MVIETANKDIEQAIDTIGWQELPYNWVKFTNTPMNFVSLKLFFGEQGSGKSVSTVACMADDIHQYINYIIPLENIKDVNDILFNCRTDEDRLFGLRLLAKQGKIIRARALSAKEQRYLQIPIKFGGKGVHYDHLKHVRIYNTDGTKSKIISLADDYIVMTPAKIFSNRTIYGISSTFGIYDFDPEMLFREINSDLLYNGWCIVSESVLINRKTPTSFLNQFMEMFGAEGRKRHVRMAVDMQYRRQLSQIFHLYATTTVECEYDLETGFVSLDVNKSSPEMVSTEYNSKPYRKYYWSDEHMKVPEYKIERALKSIGAEE